MATFKININGLNFKDLQTPEGLARLDVHFVEFLSSKSPELAHDLQSYRLANPMPATAQSALLIHLGELLAQFIQEVFGIKDAATALRNTTLQHNPVGQFKKQAILTLLKKRLQKETGSLSFTELDAWLKKRLDLSKDPEYAVAHYGLGLMEQNDEGISQLIDWCAALLLLPEHPYQSWSLFQFPQKLDYEHLIQLENGQLPSSQQRHRDGFGLTDPRMNAREIQNEINYCIYCHDHEGDLCRKGFPQKKKQPELGFRKNALDITLTGCPLEEKISEMHVLKRNGHAIGALAMIMVDNPMCPATGHRICNDCMKSCIYQKQSPVDIPQVETRILTDVLNLPWGVEIYDLLTRWNPLRQDQWLMKPYNGLKVMIAGMGPAGFTMAHHLLQEGFAVTGVDGLKIEPLPQHYLDQPIENYHDIEENLDERLLAGFGGVAEYGITVRWDKNFLKLIYISLMRRSTFQVFGATRFGGSIRVEDAWDLGFDHLVLAVGAGLPRALPIPGSLAPGMRQANDFLMALQLTGAAKKDSLANLQIRLPAIVIGGGLTGVDAATEVQAYYITQVEKIHARYQTLRQSLNEEAIREKLDIASQDILAEYLSHADAIIEERKRAKAKNELPNFTQLIHKWGGVSIVYRKRMQDSPAYRNNHEELHKALEEGLFYREQLSPTQVILDKHGHCEQLECHHMVLQQGEWAPKKDVVMLPAKCILVATGASLNVAYSFEHKDTFERKQMQYVRYEAQESMLTPAPEAEHCKSDGFGPFTSYDKNDKRVTFIGDTHPVFHGNVVKAIASAKRTYPIVVSHLVKKMTFQTPAESYSSFSQTIAQQFETVVTRVERKTPSIVEITVRAPLLAKRFEPGQFFRAQNFESLAPIIQGTRLQAEGVALTPVSVNTDELTFMLIKKGASARILAMTPPGQAIALMGPTGVRSKIPDTPETILLMGSTLSLAHVRSYGAALKAAGHRVVYLGYFDSAKDLYCQQEIEAIVDMTLWVSNDGSLNSHQASCFQGDAFEVFCQFAKGHTKTEISFNDIDRIQVVSDPALLKQIQLFQKERLSKETKVFGSVYSPMQCMLKGVCAQCLQWQVDPETGLRTKAVYACSWQDQPLELIDLDNLIERHSQNALQEHLSNLWLDHIVT